MVQASRIKFLPMLVFYVVCGFGGIMFGSAVNKEASLTLGCQPAVYAMVASLISLLIVNWKALAPMESARFMLIIFLILVFVFMLLYTLPGQTANQLSYKVVDVASNCGGFIIGFCFGLVIMPRVRRQASFVGSYEKLCMKIGAALTLVYFAILMSLFYTTVAYPINFFN